MQRFYGLSGPLRFLGYAALAAMAALLLYAVISRQPPQPILTGADVEASAEAAVQGTLSALTAAAPTPNVQSTVDARLTQVAQGTQPAPATPAPTPDIAGQVEDVANEAADVLGGLLASIWNFLVGIWNFFAFGGWALQCLCCIGLPALIVIGLAAENLHG